MAYKKSSDELRKKPSKKQVKYNKSRNNSKSTKSTKMYEPSNEIYSHSKDKSFDLSTIGNKAKSKKSRKHLIITNVLLSILLVISTISFSVTALLESNILKNNDIDAQEEAGKFEEIMVSPNENVSYFLVCGVDLSENLTDIIMVVCYDTANNEASILQIPRDTYVGDVPTGKINAVYGNPREGESKIKALIRCINSKLGIPIDHYITVTVGGTEKVIDAIGGLDITLDRDFKLVDDSRKPEQVKYFNKGRVHLDGQWATALIRNRKNTDGGSDMGRLKNQRSIYAALLKQLTNISFGEATEIVTKCMNEVSTDLSLGYALGYAEKVNQLKLDKVQIMSLPGQGATIGGLSCWVCHKQETVDMINEYFRPYETELLTADQITITDNTDKGISYDNSYDNMLSGGDFNKFDHDATTAATQAQ